jgi:hypothetical protein
MLIDRGTAAYVLAVAAGVERGTLHPEHLTDVCPECGQQQVFLDNDLHLVVVYPPQRKVAVVVGCEGYWVVNPELVGVDAPNWQSVSEQVGP